MFYTISALDQCEYQEEIEKTLKEYDDFFEVNYKDEKLSFFIVPNQEMYRQISGFKEDYVVANAISYCGMIIAIEQDKIKEIYNKRKYLKILKHELAHIYFNHFVNFRSCIPKWLSEGIAVFLAKQIGNTCDNINTLFDKNANSYLWYMGGGIFIEYIFDKYRKEKLINFFISLRNIKSEKEIYENFNNIYGKTPNEILEEMCEENQISNEKFSELSFKKELKEKIEKYKKEYEEFSNDEFQNIEIELDCISDNQKYENDNNTKGVVIPTYANIENNKITLLVYDCSINFIKKDYYLKTIKKAVGEIILYNFLNKNKNIPYWFINGFATYVSDNFIFKDLDDKNVEMLFNKNIPETKSRTLAGLFIKYLIENYKKEKFLKLVNLLKDIKSEDEVNDCFIKIYEKSLKEMVELSY